MATLSRQPFAPLESSRLHNLTSTKNQQNALTTSPGKRKAESFDIDDSENVDPCASSKSNKADASSSPSKASSTSSYLLKTTTAANVRSILSPKKSSFARRTTQPKSPAPRFSDSLSSSVSISKVASPLSAPAGRSPTHGKRAGLLFNRRRTTGSYARVDPPSFRLRDATPFSLDAALKGTITGCSAAPKLAVTATPKSKKSSFAGLGEPETKSSWTFDIHEDTPEQEMTNLLQHSTCVLDISSSEETARKASRDDKENVPPTNDVSQTSTRRATSTNPDDMVVEKERVALGEMNASEFYAEGCDESSVIFVHEDEDQAIPAFAPTPKRVALQEVVEEEEPLEPESLPPSPKTQDDIDALMSLSKNTSSKAVVLEPIEGTGESFELWESGSSTDEVAASS